MGFEGGGGERENGKEGREVGWEDVSRQLFSTAGPLSPPSIPTPDNPC